MLEFNFFLNQQITSSFEHFSNDVHSYVFPFLKLQTYFKKTKIESLLFDNILMIVKRKITTHDVTFV